jgi:hypothetical protein
MRASDRRNLLAANRAPYRPADQTLALRLKQIAVELKKFYPRAERQAA